MYKVKDKVSHPEHGGCEVCDVCRLDFTGEVKTYYKLAPFVGAGASVYVPVDRADDIGVRPLISQDEANELLQSLSTVQEPWLADTVAKQRRYKALFEQNTVEGLYDTLSAMSAIVKRKLVKDLGSFDKSMLSAIQNKVLSEVALAKNISMEDAIEQAEEIILQAQ